jgi:hypothetical protein
MMPAFVQTVGLQDLLRCPETGGPVGKVGEAYVSEKRPDITFPIEAGVVRAFLPHDRARGDVTELMKAFYEEHPFPNYDGMDDLGSLI